VSVVKIISPCLLINFLVVVFIFFVMSKLPPVIPLFYGSPEGETQLAPQTFLFIPPLICLVITLVNSMISRLLKDEFLQKVLIGAIYTTTILSTITVVKIVFLIGNI